MEKLILTTVEWLDAAYSDRDLNGPIKCISSGILVRENVDCVMLAGDRFEDAVVRHVTAIPKTYILRRRDTFLPWKPSKYEVPK